MIFSGNLAIFLAQKIARLPRIFQAKLIQPPLKKSARTLRLVDEIKMFKIIV